MLRFAGWFAGVWLVISLAAWLLLYASAGAVDQGMMLVIAILALFPAAIVGADQCIKPSD